MGYAFISYSSKHANDATAIYQLLRKNNIDAWMAPGDIPVGMVYAEILNKAILGCSCFILVLTKETQTSNWVPRETERAASNGKPIFPLKLEEVELTDQFQLYISSHQMRVLNSFDENSETIKSLIKAVKAYTGELGEDSTYSIDRRFDFPDKVFCSTPEVKVGSIIYEKYEICNYLESGCYANTYMGRTLDTNENVALHIVQKKDDFDTYRERLSWQVRLSKKICHPAFAAIREVIENNKYCVVVTDYISGDSIVKYFDENQLNEQTVIRIGKELCEAAGYLHSQQPPIIHCNFNHSNIMIRDDGKVMISNLDWAFELNNRENPGFHWGTIQYVAPEFYKRQVDERTDIYSIGMIMFRLSSRRNPSFRAFGVALTFDELIKNSTFNPLFSKKFQEVIFKCCEFDPGDRYQTAFDLLKALIELERSNALNAESQRTCPGSSSQVAETGGKPQSHFQPGILSRFMKKLFG